MPGRGKCLILLEVSHNLLAAKCEEQETNDSKTQCMRLFTFCFSLQLQLIPREWTTHAEHCET
eukprot:1151350-Pelagomonas_calceolata.AAC.4